MSGSQCTGMVRGLSSQSQDIGSFVSPRQKFRKGERSRRMWTLREEEILASTLLELVARGWKSDNGFRAGYLQKIVDSIRAEFPNTDIKGSPHVTSKIQVWKKNYNSLRSILARSGVGFNNDGQHRIDCDDEQWEKIVQADKDAKGMRHKSWPFWETWKSIFDKDRATGVAAEQLDAAAEALRNKHSVGSETNENDYRPSFEDFLGEEMPPIADQGDANDVSSGTTVRNTANTKSAGLKRKAPTTDDALMDFLANLHTETNKRLEVISSRIGYEFELGKARQEVFDKLGTVDGLTLEERYELCDILSEKSQRLEVFIGMPPTARLGYVRRFLKDYPKAN